MLVLPVADLGLEASAFTRFVFRRVYGERLFHQQPVVVHCVGAQEQVRDIVLGVHRPPVLCPYVESQPKVVLRPGHAPEGVEYAAYHGHAAVVAGLKGEPPSSPA